jgi:hypothetical protein
MRNIGKFAWVRLGLTHYGGAISLLISPRFWENGFSKPARP